MEVPSTLTVENNIARNVNDGDCTCPLLSDTCLGDHVDGLREGIGNIGDKILGFVDDAVSYLHCILDSFIVHLPLTQVTDPSSGDGNLGNNVHLPSLSPGGVPYRFGLHIRRDDLGYMIARVFEDTIAHHAKLQKDDIVTHLNDIELTSTNIVKVLTLFSTVGNPFSLTILREVESGEKVEIIIEINIDINEIVKTIEIKVTVRGPRYIRDRNYPMPPFYITQDPDGASQQYVNVVSNGNLIMGYDLVAFVFERYITIYSSDGSQPSILKTRDGQRVFDFERQKMMNFDPARIESYLLNATASNNGSYVFEQLNRQGNGNRRYFLNNANDEVVVSRFDNPDSVPSSGRFSVHTIEHVTTSTTIPGRRQGGPRH